jgi:hypothetical protein
VIHCFAFFVISKHLRWDILGFSNALCHPLNLLTRLNNYQSPAHFVTNYQPPHYWLTPQGWDNCIVNLLIWTINGWVNKQVLVCVYRCPFDPLHLNHDARRVGSLLSNILFLKHQIKYEYLVNKQVLVSILPTGTVIILWFCNRVIIFGILCLTKVWHKKNVNFKNIFFLYLGLTSLDIQISCAFLP